MTTAIKTLAAGAGLSLLFALVMVSSGVAPAAAEAKSVEWSLAAPDGKVFSFPADHDGPVVLLFWASWCPYCKALMPHLQSIAEEYKSLSIYAISFRDDGDPAGYLESQGFTFKALHKGDDVAAAYSISGTPGLLVFDTDKNIVLNLYDVMERYNETVVLPEKLNHRQKAARKAPFWAAEIRQTLDRIQ